MKTLLLSSLALLALVLPITAHAQTSQPSPLMRNWTRVLALKPGTTIEISTNSEPLSVSRLARVDDVQIGVLSFDKPAVAKTIPRDAVTEISARRRVGGSSVRAVLFGIGGICAGLVGGGLIGVAVDNLVGGSGQGGAIIGSMLGAPTGMVWGGVAGYRTGGRLTNEVIYRAQGRAQ